MPVNSEDESSELETFIEDSSTNLEDIVENSILNREILRLLKETLSDEKQFYVIMRRFGFGGSDPQTLEEIGQTLHVSRERIRQIEQNAIRKLKNNEKLKKCLII